MRIAVDCRWIFKEISGIGRYTERLVRALVRGAGGGVEFVLYVDSSSTRLRLADLESRAPVKIREVSCRPFSPLSQILLPLDLMRRRVDVFFSPNFMVPLACPGVRVVFTVHDLIPLLFPDFVARSLKTRFYRVFALILRLCARRARKLVAVSEHTRADVLRALRVPESKVKVVYNGFDRLSEAGAGGAGVLPPFAAGCEGKKVILYAGRFDPYKNVCGLIQAFEIIAQRDANVVLWLVGKTDPRYPEVQALIVRSRFRDRIRPAGYLSDEQLSCVYRRADAVVLPSFYEGFGLGILEGFAFGVPVAASRAASIPEVAGDAAVLFDPRDAQDMARSLERLLGDAQLRKDCVEKGRERLKLFTWDRAAAQMMDVFREVSARGARGQDLP